MSDPRALVCGYLHGYHVFVLLCELQTALALTLLQTTERADKP